MSIVIIIVVLIIAALWARFMLRLRQRSASAYHAIIDHVRERLGESSVPNFGMTGLEQAKVVASYERTEGSTDTVFLALGETAKQHMLAQVIAILAGVVFAVLLLAGLFYFDWAI